MKSVTLIAINAKYCHTSLAIRSIGAFCKEKEQFGDGAAFVTVLRKPIQFVSGVRNFLLKILNFYQICAIV